MQNCKGKKPKLKKCKVCLEEFLPFSSLAKACSVACSLILIRAADKVKASKEFNSETRRMKNEIKSRSQWLKECQQVFNSFIRERDKSEPCISCGRHHNGQYHAGHYKSVGANPELRFNESNCHKQCAPCNNHLSGNISNYRPRLVAKIGAKGLDELEALTPPKKYTIEELKELKKFYQRKLKSLNNEG